MILLNSKHLSRKTAMEQSLLPKLDRKCKNRLCGQTYSCLLQAEDLDGSRTTEFEQREDDLVAKFTTENGVRPSECLYRNRDSRDLAQLFEFLFGECQRRCTTRNIGQ